MVLTNKMKWGRQRERKGETEREREREREREGGREKEREGAKPSCLGSGSAEGSSAEHGPTSSFVLNRHFLCKQLQSKNHKGKHTLHSTTS